MLILTSPGCARTRDDQARSAEQLEATLTASPADRAFRRSW
jgi:hypothetical protein